MCFLLISACNKYTHIMNIRCNEGILKSNMTSFYSCTCYNNYSCNQVGSIGNLLCYIETHSSTQTSTVADGYFLYERGCKIFQIIGQLEKPNLNEEKKNFVEFESAMKDTVHCHVDDILTSAVQCQPCSCIHSVVQFRRVISAMPFCAATVKAQGLQHVSMGST